MNHCGICGGGTRLFTGTRYGRPITDWKHTDVPPGTEPHRPVLGRPVDQETLDRIHRPKEEPMAEAPQVMIETSKCPPSNLPTAGQRIYQLGLDHGWTLVGCTLTRISTGQQKAGVTMKRGIDVGFGAFWAWTPKGEAWKFEDAFTVRVANGVTVYDRVGSESLKAWIQHPERICPTCGRSDRTDHEECVS